MNTINLFKNAKALFSSLVNKPPATASDASIYYYLVVPISGSLPSTFSPSFNLIVSSVKQYTDKLFQYPIEIVFVNSEQKACFSSSSANSSFENLITRDGLHFMFNTSFTFYDCPPIHDVFDSARADGETLLASRSTSDIHAYCFSSLKLKSIADKIWAPLQCLTATNATDIAVIRDFIEQRKCLFPSTVLSEFPPTFTSFLLEEKRSFTSKSPTYSAYVINTALKEILALNNEHDGQSEEPHALSLELVQLREKSSVPWVFNGLLNEIELQHGVLKTTSIPPEIHLSTTGYCNITCRFCSYTKQEARMDFVDVNQLEELDYLKHVQTLRLHSGLGEPTSNRHLASIINYVAENYPHIDMNFFTNGVTLNRRGLIDAIVGNVKWINISLNASTKESWTDQCEGNHFDKICKNLRELLKHKIAKKTLFPLVYASMVIHKDNLKDLPEMPKLCRSLGIDRFTVIPFYSFGYQDSEKYGPEMSLSLCREQYDLVYLKTLEAAKQYEVTIELPPPSEKMQTSFGLEVRDLHDFAKIVVNEWPLKKLTESFFEDREKDQYCHYLWRQAAIGSTND